MRSTLRLSMAAVLLIAAAGIARAQDSAAPPPVAPEAVVAPLPVPELPALPVVDPNGPAVEPAPVIDQSTLAVEPVVPATVDPVPVGGVEKPEVTTTTKRVTKKTTKPATKPEAKPAIDVSVPAKPAAAAASMSAVDSPANPPPPNAAASTAPSKSVAPPPPAANPAIETLTEAKSERKMGLGGWLIAGFVMAALFVAITMFRRRKVQKRASIAPPLADLSLDLEPIPVTRP